MEQLSMINQVRSLRIVTPRWSQLHAIGSSSFARATILIPLIGYLIIFNNNLIEYLDLSVIYVANFSILLSYKIFIFYFGLAFIAVGSMIFYFRCPDTVKYYPDDLEYVNLERQNISNVYIEHIREEVASYFASVESTGALISGYLGKLSANLEDLYKDYRVRESAYYEQYIPAILSAYWMIENRKYKIWRTCSFLSYAVGFVLLAVPAIDTFIGVCIAFLRKLSF